MRNEALIARQRGRGVSEVVVRCGCSMLVHKLNTHERCVMWFEWGRVARSVVRGLG